MPNLYERRIANLMKAIEYGETAKSQAEQARQAAFLSREGYLRAAITANALRLLYVQAARYDEAVFEYDRQTAANYAINESRNNFDKFTSDILDVDIPGAPLYGKVSGAQDARDYSCYLSHRQGSTGSSTWISEVLHYGGKLPMTLSPSLNPLDCDVVTGTLDEAGWKNCPNGSETCTQYGSASLNWRDHVGLLKYFGDFPSALGFKIGEVQAEEVNEAIYFDDIFTGVAGTVKSGGEIRLKQIFDGRRDELNTIQRGDYAFTCLVNNQTKGVDCLNPNPNEPKTSNHGFIVVGWGPVHDTLEALNAGNLNPVRSETHVVPYVADFCFGTNGVDNFNTGWLQDPRPRPFYASAVRMPASRLNSYEVFHDDYSVDEYKGRLRTQTFQPFVKEGTETRPTWEVYRMPDAVRIPLDRIYHS